MRRTIYLPDALADRLKRYLREHPEQTVSGVVQELLEAKLEPRPIGGLLALAGFVETASTEARERAEDEVARRHRP